MPRAKPATEVARIKLLNAHAEERQGYIVNNWQKQKIDGLLNALGVQGEAERLRLGDKLRSWFSYVSLEYGRTIGIRNLSLPTLGNIQFSPADIVAALEQNLLRAIPPYGLIAELGVENGENIPLPVDVINDAVVFKNEKELPPGLASAITSLMNTEEISFDEAKTRFTDKLKREKKAGSNKAGALAAQWACALLLRFVAHEMPDLSKIRKENFLYAALKLINVPCLNPQSSLTDFRRFVADAEKFNQSAQQPPQSDQTDADFERLRDLPI